MTLLEQLNRIKSGEARPQVAAEDVPCNETSDRDRLCKRPVVSVQMVTYNHEPYIRQAIEGVLMQETDFDYELVIGEDCSTDRTREICFEYQKKYPERIRVLWSEKNVYAIGGNGSRTTIRCRGEYLAFCEGDDYWTDPKKLQKQVDLMRKTDSVMCVAFTDWLYNDGTVHHSTYKPVTMLGIEDFKNHYFHTTTYVFKREVYNKMISRYAGIAVWHDMIMLFCILSMGRVCLLPEIVSVYRWSGSGIASSLSPYKSHCFRASMFFDLFCHGPVELRPFSARCAIGAVQELFMANRRYKPAMLMRREFVDLVKSRAFIRKSVAQTLSIGLIEDVNYGASLMFYWLRRLFRLGLKI